MRNTSKISQQHADRVLEAMRKEMKTVPKVNMMSVIAIVYLTIMKAHYSAKK